jgi:hypothetical protein
MKTASIDPAATWASARARSSAASMAATSCAIQASHSDRAIRFSMAMPVC